MYGCMGQSSSWDWNKWDDLMFWKVFANDLMIWDGFSFEWWNEWLMISWLIGERSSNRLCHHGRQNGSADQSLLRRFSLLRSATMQGSRFLTLETVSGNRAYSVNYESLKSNILWGSLSPEFSCICFRTSASLWYLSTSAPLPLIPV